MFIGSKDHDESCYIQKNTYSHLCSLCTEQASNKELMRCDECFQYFHITCLSNSYSEDNKKNIHLDLQSVYNSVFPDTNGSPPRDSWYCKNCNPRPLFGSCWIPVGDIDVKEGVLALLAKSDHMPHFDR